MYDATGKISQSELVNRYSPIVRRLSLQMISRLPSSVDLDDLIQAGMMGLLDAASRYQQTVGATFETYANQRIRGAMIDELRTIDWMPRTLRRSSREVEVAVQEVEHILGRSANETEIASHMKLALDDYQRLLQDVHGSQVIYYEDFMESDEDDPFLDRHYIDRGDPLAVLLDENLRASLTDAIERLPEREKLLMSLYYERGMNLRELGEVMDVSESRACQLHSQAVSRVRARLRELSWVSVAA